MLVHGRSEHTVCYVSLLPRGRLHVVGITAMAGCFDLRRGLYSTRLVRYIPLYIQPNIPASPRDTIACSTLSCSLSFSLSTNWTSHQLLFIHPNTATQPPRRLDSPVQTTASSPSSPPLPSPVSFPCLSPSPRSRSAALSSLGARHPRQIQPHDCSDTQLRICTALAGGNAGTVFVAEG